ncbi:MAG: type II toxin-antitoxin system HicB family antitoxin [Chloroflexota bacterium]
MLTEYVNAALKRAEYEPLDENEGWFASIPDFPGLWASGATIEETREELRSALEDWLLVGVRRGRDLPMIDGIDLNARSVA